jgi:hypothetical protein
MSLPRFFLGASVFLLAFTIISAAQQTTIVTVPMTRVPSYSGAGMYTHYCAACHGKDGTGNGPATKALQADPPDLTRLARQNHGKFPYAHVYTVIRGDINASAAHGKKDMPVWGTLFAEAPGQHPMDWEVLSESTT